MPEAAEKVGNEVAVRLAMEILHQALCTGLPVWPEVNVRQCITYDPVQDVLDPRNLKCIGVQKRVWSLPTAVVQRCPSIGDLELGSHVRQHLPH